MKKHLFIVLLIASTLLLQRVGFAFNIALSLVFGFIWSRNKTNISLIIIFFMGILFDLVYLWTLGVSSLLLLLLSGVVVLIREKFDQQELLLVTVVNSSSAWIFHLIHNWQLSIWEYLLIGLLSWVILRLFTFVDSSGTEGVTVRYQRK